MNFKNIYLYSAVLIIASFHIIAIFFCEVKLKIFYTNDLREYAKCYYPQLKTMR